MRVFASAQPKQGFGKGLAKPKSGSSGGQGGSSNTKQKNVRLDGAPTGPSMVSPPSVDAAKILEDKDFEERLKLAQEKGSLLKKELELKGTGASPDILFSGPAEINYDKPPPLAQTLGLQSSKPAAGGVGPIASQAAGAILAGVLLAVFLATNSGSDLEQQTMGYMPRATGQEAELSSEEKDRWTKERVRFEAALAENPSDVASLEGLAVSLVELRELDKAEESLAKLVQLDPQNSDAYRLLGETRVTKGDTKKGVEAYRLGVEAAAGVPSIELLQGYVGSLVVDGRQGEAVTTVQTYKEKFAGLAEPPIGDVEMDLLLGKVFSQWSGHVGDASGVYDRIIRSHPEDFRGYLAKAILLRDDGRKADAERLFIQAKFYAPAGPAKSLVDRLAGKS